jgi:hypothetical protein
MVVVIVVAMERTSTPASNGPRPAKAGWECMRAGVESGDMVSTLGAMLRCGQQIHLQLLLIRCRARQSAAGEMKINDAGWLRLSA